MSIVYSSKTLIMGEISVADGDTVNYLGGTDPLEIPKNCHQVSLYCSGASSLNAKVEAGFAQTATIFNGASEFSEYGVSLSNFVHVTIPLGNAEQNNGSRVFWIRNNRGVASPVNFLFIMSNGQLDRNQDYAIAFPQKF